MSSKKKAKQKTPLATPPADAPLQSADTLPTDGPAAPVPLRDAPEFPKKLRWLPVVLMFLFFFGTCLTTQSTVKALAMTVMIATVVSCLIRFSNLRDRLSLPMAAIFLWVLMNGVSTFYAVSGKFALREFLRLLIGFCVLLLILAWERKGPAAGRACASILAGGTALASIVSIDMLSTHWISVPFFKLMQSSSLDYVAISSKAVEVGVRMNSLYENPNVFAGIAGLGVLLSLGLAASTSRARERNFHLCCLFINSLAFLLVFSMGASGMIALAFLVLLLLEQRQRKASLLILMIETLVLVLIGAFPVFLTSFGKWTGFQPIPMLCTIFGSVALCLADRFLGQKLAHKLAFRGGKLVGLLFGAVFLLMVVFAGLAVTMTGPATLEAGESLRRAEYPQPGAYTLEVQSSAPVQVTIQSQNQQETMMHTNTVLYSGPAQGASFTVPEDSLVTYFNFYAGEALTLDSASFTGEQGSTSLKLHYKLLPGFIANRLQGLFANQNAIQRVVFFADGMKLVRRSPIFGLGMGAFENSVQGVQSFHYETKYAHNHYIETLVSTGIVGFVLFIGMLLLCALAVWKNLRRKEDAHSLAPALGAALIFMMGHAGVEVVFSFHYYLPIALGVLGLICLCCGQELPFPTENEEVRSWCVVGVDALIVVFAVFLGLNMKAVSIAKQNSEGDIYRSMERAAKLDFFEKNDYLLSYVFMAKDADPETEGNILEKANQYAVRLAAVDSNSIPPYLAHFYLSTDQAEEAFSTLNKYVDYCSADSDAWQQTFLILQAYSEELPQCREAAKEIYQKFQTWNADNMGSLTLTAENQQYLNEITGQ